MHFNPHQGVQPHGITTQRFVFAPYSQLQGYNVSNNKITTIERYCLDYLSTEKSDLDNFLNGEYYKQKNGYVQYILYSNFSDMTAQNTTSYTVHISTTCEILSDLGHILCGEKMWDTTNVCAFQCR